MSLTIFPNEQLPQSWLSKSATILLFWLLVSQAGLAQVVDTLVDVGSYRLHFHIIRGTTAPILFEAGGGDNATIWNKLVKPVQQQTGATLITYDRAGIGQSEIDTTHINLVNEIIGLETALTKLGYFDQLILVAHSFGGTYATLFSERNKQLVKGVVFVDCNLACFNDAATARQLKDLYKDQMESLRKKSVGTYYSLLHYEEYNALYRTLTFPSSIPATVISSDIAPFSGPMGIRWRACQKSFGQAPNHRYVLAKGSTHYIHQDNPDLVSREIVALYKQVFPAKP